MELHNTWFLASLVLPRLLRYLLKSQNLTRQSGDVCVSRAENCCRIIESNNILVKSNIYSISRAGKNKTEEEWWGGQSSSASACAPVTVRPAPPTGNVEDKKGRLVSFVFIWDREGEQFTSTLNLVSVFAHCVCLRVSVNVRAGSIPTPWSRAVWRSDHTWLWRCRGSCWSHLPFSAPPKGNTQNIWFCEHWRILKTTF